MAIDFILLAILYDSYIVLRLVSLHLIPDWIGLEKVAAKHDLSFSEWSFIPKRLGASSPEVRWDVRVTHPGCTSYFESY